jgi:hypothetical protein
VEATTVYSGGRALKFPASNSAVQFASMFMIAQPTRRYRVRIRYQGSAIQTGRATLYMKFGGGGAGAINLNLDVGTANTWLTKETVLTSGASDRYFFLWVETTVANASGNLFVDSIEVNPLENLVHALAHIANAQTLVNNTAAYINFDGVDQDTDSAVTTGAAWKWTCPAGKDGEYHVDTSVAVNIPNGTGFDSLIEIFKNGAAYFRGNRLSYTMGTGAIVGLTASASVAVVGGDTIQVQVYQNSGANRTTETLSGRISIAKVRD